MSQSVRSPKAQRQARARRAFLKTVGRAAAALPFYRLIRSSAVYAAAGDQPQRFIGLYAPHGISEAFYNRRAGETETSFAINYPEAALAPFDDAAGVGKSFKNKITIVQGVDLAAGIEKQTNGHNAACVMLTGGAPNGEKASNESLDQFLAVTHNLGAQTRFASVVLGVGTKKTDTGGNISYAKGGAPLSKVIDPAETFNMLFANLVVGTDPGAAAALERAKARSASVLDYLRKDIGRLQTRLATPERVKLEQHLTSLRELEKQTQGGGAGGASEVCNQPAKPNPTEFPKLQIFNGGEPYLDKITDLQIELLAQAIACDLTRFATLFIGLTEDIHNSVAHAYSAARGQYEPGKPESQVALAKQNRYYFTKAARLLKRLDDMAVLDSTLVYISSDMGDPAMHSLRNVPTVLAGGANGKLKMGRFLSVASDCPPANYYCDAPQLTANNHILVAIAQAFGVAVNSFGTADAPAVTTGALSGLI